MKTFSKIFLGAFFGIQIAGIIIGRFTDVKYFCWAPYDQISKYSISVKVNGVQLSRDVIEERYHKPASSFENRNINNLKTIIQRYEKTYGKEDQAEVKLEYQTNKGEDQIWNWPRTNTRAFDD
ncbi:hypothetical protein [Hyunsoonleella rubra]|uniref:Uncharacterized protein n=1 Tax=Hyunsoonleella rubra TaxID=1737062 RepID=A0ABW5T9Y7_9FLAO